MGGRSVISMYLKFDGPSQRRSDEAGLRNR